MNDDKPPGYDAKIRESLDQIYANLAERVKKIDFDTIKKRFSESDDFILVRQEKNLKEEESDDDENETEFDLNNEMQNKVLNGRNLDFISKVADQVSGMNTMKKLKLEDFVARRNRKNERLRLKRQKIVEDREKSQLEQNCFDSVNEKKLQNVNFEKSSTHKIKKISTIPSVTTLKKVGLREEDIMKSKEIISKMYKNRVVLNTDLDRPLSFEERFNAGDFKLSMDQPQEITLMEKLENYAKESMKKHIQATPVALKTSDYSKNVDNVFLKGVTNGNNMEKQKIFKKNKLNLMNKNFDLKMNEMEKNKFQNNFYLKNNKEKNDENDEDKECPFEKKRQNK